MTQTIRHALLVAALAYSGAALASGAAQDPASQVPAFRGHADGITVEVSVRRGTRTVGGLRLGDFELLDNGVRQSPTLSVESLPIDVTILLDVSGSVSGPVLDQLRQSVNELRADLKAGDRLRLLVFNMRVMRLFDVDATPATIDKAFATLTPGGSSAVLDGLAVALASPVETGRRAFIVAFTDGEDSSSLISPGKLLDVARRTTPTVNTVLATSVNRGDDDVYTTLAAETGGQTESLRPGERLGSAFRRLFAEYRESYVLRYAPTGVERVGTHTIDVRVNRPGTVVRARRGYVVGR